MTETGDVAPALDFTAFDHGVRVQDDLFRHVNGTWLANAEIPADKPLAGAFMNLRDRAEEAVRDIITTIEADSGFIRRRPRSRTCTPVSWMPMRSKPWARHPSPRCSPRSMR